MRHTASDFAASDFEVSFKGKTFLTVNQGQLDVQGVDFKTDLVNISRLMAILSDVMDEALTAQAETTPTSPSAPRKITAAHSSNVYQLHAGQQN